MRAKLILLIPCLLLLAACTRDRAIPPIKDSDKASVKLAEAANSVSRSISELARIQAEATPPVKGHKLVDPEKLGMRQSASVDWSGPIEPLVRKISSAIHYRVRVLGTTPAVPVVISLTAQHAQIASILRDIDFQAGPRAYINIFPRSKVIELRYANA